MVSGRELFNFLQFLAAPAFAAFLTDRIAGAFRSAGALKLAGGLERTLLAVYCNHRLPFFDLCHFPLYQRFTAGAFPIFPGDCIARTPFTAAADIDHIPDLQDDLAIFDRSYR